MLLENIILSNFKNYKTLNLAFSRQINCFVGDNGAGKTNLLDAIYFLSMTKSAFNNTDSQNIRHDENFFLVKGCFAHDDKKYTVRGNFQIGQKKTIKVNDKAYAKISEHIGAFPIVLIAPNDTDIIREGSDTRRRFFDRMICQIDKVYLQNLIRYNQVVKQRNSLLRQFYEQKKQDIDLLEPFDYQISDLGSSIHTKRAAFMQEFLPLFIEHYQYLSESKEETNILYISDFQCDNFKLLLSNARKKDLALQRSTCGTHKDDFIFKINDYPVKKFASQGQQKSFLAALKFAQFDIIKKNKGFKPILLLDDIFDKLDDKRITKLMEKVACDNFDQLFITDARPERTLKFLKKINSDIQVFKIDSDIVSLLEHPNMKS